MNNYVKVFLWYHTGKKCQKKKGAFFKKGARKNCLREQAAD